MYRKKPDWLKIRIRSGQEKTEVEEILKKYSLNTVCEEANCPNKMECFSKHTATFMILGRNCTRNCTFCNVNKAIPEPVNEQEPLNIANAVNELQLKHVVITSVTRDDLSDGGAEHFARVTRQIKKKNAVTVEVLIPDFQGVMEPLKKVINAKPEIINHNVETVPRLYKMVRPMALYSRSLEVLKRVKSIDKHIYTKSGIMVGLGEKENEIRGVLKDLRSAGCELLTIGQYLAPSLKHYPVKEYIHPEIFKKYKKKALEMGFKCVMSGPLVRSSYNAAAVYNSCKR